MDSRPRSEDVRSPPLRGRRGREVSQGRGPPRAAGGDLRAEDAEYADALTAGRDSAYEDGRVKGSARRHLRRRGQRRWECRRLVLTKPTSETADARRRPRPITARFSCGPGSRRVHRRHRWQICQGRSKSGPPAPVEKSSTGAHKIRTGSEIRVERLEGVLGRGDPRRVDADRPFRLSDAARHLASVPSGPGRLGTALGRRRFYGRFHVLQRRFYGRFYRVRPPIACWSGIGGQAGVVTTRPPMGFVQPGVRVVTTPACLGAGLSVGARSSRLCSN